MLQLFIFSTKQANSFKMKKKNGRKTSTYRSSILQRHLQQKCSIDMWRTPYRYAGP